MSDVRQGSSRSTRRAAALALLLALCALFLSGSCPDGYDTAAAARHDHHRCTPAEPHLAAQPADRAHPDGPGGGPVTRRPAAPRVPAPCAGAAHPGEVPPVAGHRLLIALGVDRN
ncbi:hypothetical protein [Streptomyces sp. cg35]|uniref:hypothetical protein n=1 Tax=Streptomyces sp. cg35 TaxID=3421650 RepID=UPI003D1651DE